MRHGDVRDASVALTATFHDDPLMQWFFPDDATRPILLNAYMRASIALSMQRGHAFAALDPERRVVGAALWGPPDIDLFGPEGFRTHWMVILGANPHRTDELRDGIAMLGAAHPVDVGHFYLNIIGIEPSCRGTGLGSKVMNRVLDTADAEQVPCYLESSNIRNVSLYERYGFEVTSEIELPNGPVFRPMWRDPK